MPGGKHLKEATQVSKDSDSRAEELMPSECWHKMSVTYLCEASEQSIFSVGGSDSKIGIASDGSDDHRIDTSPSLCG